MKLLFLFFFILAIFAPSISGQCKDEPAPDKTGKVLKKMRVRRPQTLETGLSIVAKVSGASWQSKGAEAAVLTVFVDGKYDQDVMLFAGSRAFDYKVLLGELDKGSHDISLVLNKERSAKNIGQVEILSAKIVNSSEPGPWEKIAIARSPFIYARPNAVDKFSDIPLITYYEILSEADNSVKIRYTTIFTNEDGGTQTMALMARWGRATDIEWIYELSFKNGKLVSETIQGANHKIENFAGTRVMGGHPLIYTVTDNNNFSDAGCSALRTAPFPVQADLSQRSRETVMDENPWTYRIMAEEAMREGRVDPKNIGVNTIDDPRNYLYVDVYTETKGAGISVEATATDGKISRSDFGDARLRISRNGFQRIAVPFASPASKLASLTLSCHALSEKTTSGSCGRSRIAGYMILDKDFVPVKHETVMDDRTVLEPGQKIAWQPGR